MPRLLLVTLLAIVTTGAAAADGTPPAPAADAPQPAPAADDAAAVPPRAVNKLCPVTGDPIDRNVPVQVVTLTREGRSQRVAVGVCCEDCIEDVKREPQRYAAAALENRKAPKPAK